MSSMLREQNRAVSYFFLVFLGRSFHSAFSPFPADSSQGSNASEVPGDLAEVAGHERQAKCKRPSSSNKIYRK